MKYLHLMKKRLLHALGDDELATATYSYEQFARVQWDCLQPAGTPYQIHKLSILDAIELASSLLGTAYRQEHEWLLVGRKAREIIMTLPQTRPALGDGLFNGPTWRGYTRLGASGHRIVYYTQAEALRTHMVLYNDNGRCAHIVIVNGNG